MDEKDKQLLQRAVDEIQSLRKTNQSQADQLSIVHTFRALILKEDRGWMSEDIVPLIKQRLAEPNQGAEPVDEKHDDSH
jgi:hypothetical protein